MEKNIMLISSNISMKIFVLKPLLYQIKSLFRDAKWCFDESWGFEHVEGLNRSIVNAKRVTIPPISMISYIYQFLLLNVVAVRVVVGMEIGHMIDRDMYGRYVCTRSIL